MVNVKIARPNSIEKKIVAALRKVDRQYLRYGKKDSKWTRAIKNAIGDVGKKLGYEVYAAQCKYGHYGEWMCDLIWCKMDDDITLKLPLVMESEWGKDILSDFTKLVVARAEHRVLVFYGRTLQNIQKTIEPLLKQVRNFRGSKKGDRYLFCFWTKEPDEFNYNIYITTRYL